MFLLLFVFRLIGGKRDEIVVGECKYFSRVFYLGWEVELGYVGRGKGILGRERISNEGV